MGQEVKDVKTAASVNWHVPYRGSACRPAMSTTLRTGSWSPVSTRLRMMTRKKPSNSPRTAMTRQQADAAVHKTGAEDGQGLCADNHPAEGVPDDHQANAVEVRQLARTALPPLDVRDVAPGGDTLGLVQHLRTGVDGQDVHSPLGQGDNHRAGTGGQVQDAPAREGGGEPTATRYGGRRPALLATARRGRDAFVDAAGPEVEFEWVVITPAQTAPTTCRPHCRKSRILLTPSGGPEGEREAVSPCPRRGVPVRPV